MANLTKSTKRKTGSGKPREFSSFDDFAQALLDDGVIQSKEELQTTSRDLLGELLFNWYIQGQIACVFAQMLAREATKSLGQHPKWQTVVVDAETDLTRLQQQLVEDADRLEAIQLIFLGPGTAEHAVEIVLALCKNENWTCHEKGWMKGEHGDALLVGLRWNKPSSDYVSWVLGIAPFEPMPFTRRFVGAPFIALVLRPSPPTNFNPTPIEGKFRASHLAHMDDLMGSDEEKRQRTDRLTRFNKQTLLGDELRSHARAQTTFALPASCREALRDVLRPVEEA